jgi:long-chain acyl-CoA synthetase
VNLKQIYGQTEICGIAVVHHDDDVRFHTVGVPIPETELKISEAGEIMLRSPSVFVGYVGSEAATAEAIDPDGWLHTGDAGYLDDGHLVVIDRAKDVLTSADGTRFSSAFIENKLKFSPYVEEAVVFGTDEITAMITIDAMTVGSWAENEHLTYTTYTDLAAKPEVYDLLTDEVHRANTDLPDSIKVRRFLLLFKQLDPDDDEITRTRKVRRNVIAERYAELIAALERGEESVSITNTVTYQDGTSVKRTINLKIRDLDGYQPPTHKKQRAVWSGRR